MNAKVKDVPTTTAASAADSSTPVAEANKTAVATAAGGFSYGEDGGTGFEGTSAKDLSIPFLNILQSNSPQVEADSDKEGGARAGQLFNSVTKERMLGSAGIGFIPVYKDPQFVEWVPRNKGGGFVGLHAPTTDVVLNALKAVGDKRGEKLILANGNELIETHYVYGLVINPESEVLGFAVISFTSTKIKPYRDWMTSMFMLKGKPPIFANRALIKTVKQQNEKGSFYNFEITPLIGSSWGASLVNPVTEAALLAEAKGFRDMVLSGLAKASYETQNEGAGVPDHDAETGEVRGGASNRGGKPAF